jgi:hypothetical protein
MVVVVRDGLGVVIVIIREQAWVCVKAILLM